MRGLMIFLGLLVVLIVGGALTTQIFGGGGFLPVIEQTSNPGGSTAQVERWQAEQFFLLVGFLIVNMVGIGLTIAGIFWFLNRGVEQSKAMEIETENS